MILVTVGTGYLGRALLVRLSEQDELVRFLSWQDQEKSEPFTADQLLQGFFQNEIADSHPQITRLAIGIV